MAWKFAWLLLQGHRFVFLDVPLLLESPKLARVCSAIVCVYCDADQQLDRLMHRNNYTEHEARARIAAQLPLDEKARRADHVVDNTGTREATERQVDELLQKLKPSFFQAHWPFLALAGAVIAAVVWLA